MGLFTITSGKGWSLDTKSGTLTVGRDFFIDSVEKKDIKDRVRSVVMTDGASTRSASYLFSGMKNLERVELSRLDVSDCDSMVSMFSGCVSLKSLDLFGWNTANVKDMSFMFDGCTALESIRTGPRWDLRKVTNTCRMFEECEKLRVISLSAWPSASLKDCSGMFSGCRSLEKLDLSAMDVTNVRDYSFLFFDCGSLRELNMGGWLTCNAADMSRLFCRCGSLESLDLSGWHVSEGTDTKEMFYEVPQTVHVIANDETVARVLPEGVKPDYPGWHFSYEDHTLVIDAELPDWRFPSCLRGVGEDDIPRAPWHRLTGLIERATAKPGATAKTCYRMFAGCGRLKEADLRELDISRVRELAGMFKACGSLSTVDLGSWDLGSVRHMQGFFEECSALREADLSGWDVSGVHSFDRFFLGCGSLEKVSLGNWRTNDKARLNSFFGGCESLSPEAVRCEDVKIRKETEGL